ncbi:MAG: hypothetical protein IJ795_01500 [Bacteroidales bacterium]|nr:hypothetical protein [Bacteroidales bacterium]
MSSRSRLLKIVTVIVAVAAVAGAVYIMANGLGLSEKFDFGAGAYYYADIPGYENIVRDDTYKTGVPVWVHIVLFLCWGWLMYRLWVHIDGKK